jgi:hypothetical protein
VSAAIAIGAVVGLALGIVVSVTVERHGHDDQEESGERRGAHRRSRAA